MQDLNPRSQTPIRQQTECLLTNRLIYRGSYKNLNSTARPYDQQAFSPLDLTASWLSHIHTYIHTYIRTYLHAYVCTYIYMYIYVYIYIYILPWLTSMQVAYTGRLRSSLWCYSIITASAFSANPAVGRHGESGDTNGVQCRQTSMSVLPKAGHRGRAHERHQARPVDMIQWRRWYHISH